MVAKMFDAIHPKVKDDLRKYCDMAHSTNGVNRILILKISKKKSTVKSSITILKILYFILVVISKLIFFFLRFSLLFTTLNCNIRLFVPLYGVFSVKWVC